MAYNTAHPWVQEFVARVQATRPMFQVEAYDSRGSVVIRVIRPERYGGDTIYLYTINHMSGTVFNNRLRHKVSRGEVYGALDLLLGRKLGYY